MAEAGVHFGQAHVVALPYQFYVAATGVFHGVYEKQTGIHVLHFAVKAYALHGHAADKEFFKQARVEFGHTRGTSGPAVIASAFGQNPEATHYSLHQLANEVVGVWLFAAEVNLLALAAQPRTVAYLVRPLVAIGIAFESVATPAEVAGGKPGVAGGIYKSVVVCCVLVHIITAMASARMSSAGVSCGTPGHSSYWRPRRIASGCSAPGRAYSLPMSFSRGSPLSASIISA